MTAMDDTTKETDAGLGHNQPLDPDGERAREAMRDYNVSIAKEKTGRDEAIAAAARFGAALIAGKARCKSNNEFGEWIVSQTFTGEGAGALAFRQERHAAMQIAEIVTHVAKETVDSSSTVNPFEGCPNSRPTNIMTWWRGKHPNLLTMAHAKTIGERAARILRDHRDLVDARKNDDYDYSAITEALEQDPFATLMEHRSGEDVVNKLEIEAGLRAAPKPPPVQPAPMTAPKTSAAASTAQKPVSPPPDRVQKAADNAEIATLKKEVWRLRDKLDQLSMYLVEKPPPRAEDRAFNKDKYWPVPETLERRPKDVPPRQIVNPGADLTSDPAFALRREEFEQWMVRRRESLELKYAAREKELYDTFEPRIKARVKKAVDARMAKEWMHYSPLTQTQLKTLLTVLHPDTREGATEAQKDSAARILLHTRSRLVFKDRGKGSTYIPPEPVPEPSAATLRRCGLAIDEDGELTVIDEGLFTTWCDARQVNILTIDHRAEGAPLPGTGSKT